jgi:Spy/CpxP family protein refolding chaperone
MKSGFQQTLWLSLTAVVVAIAVAEAAVAQRGEGRGGRRGGMGFGAPMVRLASNDDVQELLKLTDEQKDQVEELNDELRDEVRKLLESGGEREDWQALTKSGSDKLNGILNEDQEKRITEIAIQVYGANAVMFHPTLAETLVVTDEQREKLGEAQRENFGAMREAWQEMEDDDLSDDERREKFTKLRAEADKRLLDVLTPEQQAQLESLKGEKADIDLSQFRMGGRGGFGGRGDRDRDRDGDRERGRRDRDRDRDSDREESASTSG